MKRLLLFFVLLPSCTLQPKSQHFFSQESYKKLQPLLTNFADQKIGKIAKDIKTAHRTYQEIKNELINVYKCRHEKGYITDYKTKKPKLYKGAPLPMMFFICSDLSLIRIKVKGNPGDPYHPEPHLTKSILQNINSDFKNFDHEAFKVDENGIALPKWPKDLIKMPLKEWSMRTHIHIRENKK